MGVKPFNALRVWQRNFDVFKSYFLASIVGNIGEPVLYLFGIGVGLGSLVGEIQGVSYLAFIAPGMMAAAAMNAAAFECTFGAYTRMAEQKVYDGMLATPLSLDDIVLGEILWGATKSLISSFIMLVILALAGLFDKYEEIPLIMLNMFALGAAISSIALCYSAVSKSYEFFNFFFTLFLTPMLLFTGIYFPMDRLPAWFSSFFLIFPTTHSVAINRYLFYGGDHAMPVIGSLFLLVFVPVGVTASSYLIKRRMIPAP
jgi:lipooligosaccharide transport system permease protein